MEKQARATLPPEIWYHILSFIGEADQYLPDQNAINNFFRRENLKLVNRLFYKELAPRSIKVEFLDFYNDVRIYKDSLEYLRKRSSLYSKMLENSGEVSQQETKHNTSVFNVIALGMSGCGTTSLLASYARGQYEEQRRRTVGGAIYNKQLVDREGFTTQLNFWDFAGQSRYQYLLVSQYKAARAVLLCFSVDDRKSLQTLFDYFVPEMCRAYQCLAPDDPQPVLYLIGLKSDLQDQRQVSTDEAKIIARVLKMKYFECSAKLYQNLNEMMEELKNDLRGPLRMSCVDVPPQSVVVAGSYPQLDRGCRFCLIQ